MRCPTIHFENNSKGKIIIPTGVEDNEYYAYHFNIQNEPNENLDINMEKDGSEIKLLGVAKNKMTILPKSDSFSKTREKIDSLIQIQNQHIAKEVEPGCEEKKWAASKRTISKRPSSTKNIIPYFPLKKLKKS